MKIEYEIENKIDGYTGVSEYRVTGFVDGLMYGIVGYTKTLVDAHKLGHSFQDNFPADDARRERRRHYA